MKIVAMILVLGGCAAAPEAETRSFRLVKRGLQALKSSNKAKILDRKLRRELEDSIAYIEKIRLKTDSNGILWQQALGRGDGDRFVTEVIVNSEETQVDLLRMAIHHHNHAARLAAVSSDFEALQRHLYKIARISDDRAYLSIDMLDGDGNIEFWTTINKLNVDQIRSLYFREHNNFDRRPLVEEVLRRRARIIAD